MQGMIWWDGGGTGWSCRNSMAGAAEIAWEEATKVEARSKGMIRRAGAAEIAWAGAAEIAWEEAANVEAIWKGMIRWDGRWTGWSCRNSMGGGYKRRSEIEGDDPVGRAGAAEIAWEEATNVEARSKGMIRWDGGGTGWSCRNSIGGGYKRRSEIEGDELELQK